MHSPAGVPSALEDYYVPWSRLPGPVTPVRELSFTCEFKSARRPCRAAGYRGGAMSGTPFPSGAAAVDAKRLGFALPIREVTKLA